METIEEKAAGRNIRQHPGSAWFQGSARTYHAAYSYPFSLLHRELLLDGYKLFRRDDKLFKNCSLAVYCRCGLSVTRLMDMEATCTLPSMWVEVQIKNGPMSAKKSACVAVVYRPHHAHCDWEESLLSSISEFRSRHTNLALMIGGDFNVDITTRDSDKLRGTF